MQKAHIMLVLALILATQVAANAQLLRTGGLPNLAEGATPAAATSATAFDDKYGPPMAIDGSSATNWACTGLNLPQWFELTFAEPVTLDTIILEQRDMPNLYANAERIELAFSDGESIEVTLEDTAAPQVLHLDERTTRSLRLTMLSSYGQKHYVGIAEPPAQMFGKLMSIPDQVLPHYYALLTDVGFEGAAEIDRQIQAGELHPMDAKKRLARTIVEPWSPSPPTESNLDNVSWLSRISCAAL